MIARPYKILISLLDRAEIGNIVLENSFIDIIVCLKASCETPDCPRLDILQTANMFVGMVDPFIAARNFYLLIQDPSPENMELLLFFVTECNCDDEEMKFVYTLLTFQTCAYTHSLAFSALL